MSARRNVQVVVIVLSLAALVSATAAEGGDKEKLAEGRYETVIQGKAEKGEYAEDWVLYRVPTGFLVEAEVHAQYSRERFAITNRYWLDSRMALMRWDMQLKDSPAEYRNELSTKVFGCELAPQEVRCWIGAESGTLRVSGPYGLVPVALPSSWFVVSWVRAARLQSGIDKARLKVVVWDMGDGADDLVPEELKVVELGREKFTAADVEFDAEKVRIVWLSDRGEESPGYVTWLAPEGVPLGFQWEFREEGRPVVTKLVRYKKYVEFGPPK